MSMIQGLRFWRWLRESYRAEHKDHSDQSKSQFDHLLWGDCQVRELAQGQSWLVQSIQPHVLNQSQTRYLF